MGRESNCRCQWGDDEGQVTALLESTELRLRGDIKRRVPVASMRDVEARADGLHFVVDKDRVALALNATEAASWAKKIAAPPPSLRRKLGLEGGTRAFVLGAPSSTELAEALHGATGASAAASAMLVAIVTCEEDLRAALLVHAGMHSRTPLWIVHGKGRNATFGETPIRTFMREAGFIDSKVVSVSAAQTATRYGKPH